MHRYKRLYLLIYVNIIQEIQTDMNVYIFQQIYTRYVYVHICSYLLISVYIRWIPDLYLFICSLNIWV